MNASTRAVIWAVLFGSVLGWGITEHVKTHHDCTAPCVVHFSKPMAEDNFKIDYIDHRGDAMVKVWKAAP